jgi:hypothetical protein
VNFFRDVVLAAAVQPRGGSSGPTLGPELINNGDMSSSTGWTFDNPGGAGVAEISGGKLRLSDDGGGLDPSASRAVTLTNGATYRVTFDVDAIGSGGLEVILGGGSIGESITTTGAKSYDVVAGPDDAVLFETSFDGTGIVIDNLSVKLLS